MINHLLPLPDIEKIDETILNDVREWSDSLSLFKHSANITIYCLIKLIVKEGLTRDSFDSALAELKLPSAKTSILFGTSDWVIAQVEHFFGEDGSTDAVLFSLST